MPLAKPGDPLVIGAGARIIETKGSDEDFDALTEREQNERRVIPRFDTFTAHRQITERELPEEDPREMTAVAVIVALRMIGLDNTSMAQLLRTDVDEIDRIAGLSSAQEMFERLFRSIIDTNATTVHGRIASYANDAVNTVVELMQDQKQPGIVRLKSSQDILDRSGTNAEQVFANEGFADKTDELEIVMTSEGETEQRVDVRMKRSR